MIKNVKYVDINLWHKYLLFSFIVFIVLTNLSFHQMRVQHPVKCRTLSDSHWTLCLTMFNDFELWHRFQLDKSRALEKKNNQIATSNVLNIQFPNARWKINTLLKVEMLKSDIKFILPRIVHRLCRKYQYSQIQENWWKKVRTREKETRAQQMSIAPSTNHNNKH